MTAVRLLSSLAYDDADSAPSFPPSTKRPCAVRRYATHDSRLDPVEAALLSRPLWDSRQPEPAVHEVLYRFDMGDVMGALAAADSLLDGRRVPALTVSLDVLDEIELDRCAVLVLAHIDGVTHLSQVLDASSLSLEDGLRTLCELIERRIILLRAAPR